MAPFIKEVVEVSGLVGVCMEGRLAGGCFSISRSSLGSDAQRSQGFCKLENTVNTRTSPGLGT